LKYLYLSRVRAFWTELKDAAELTDAENYVQREYIVAPISELPQLDENFEEIIKPGARSKKK